MSVIVKAENISKRYMLGHTGYGSFKSDVQAVLNRLVGKGAAPVPQDRKEFYALRDVNFEIKAGERIGIIGANGAGKSTLLKILSRVTLPTTGRVRMKGRVASLLEVGTGFHPDLTGRENIYLNGAILGMTRQEIKSKFDEIVDFSGVELFLDTPVKRYSSGMYVRLAFAVAAHLEPEILIIDEVLAVGDALFQQKCIGKMNSVVTNEGRTVIFVSHSMGTVSALCDRTIFMKNGQVAFDGATGLAVQHYLDSLFTTQSLVKYEESAHLEAQVMEVTLLNAKNVPSNSIDIIAPFSVEVKYVIRQALSGAIVGVSIFSSTNECVLSTCDFDLDRSKLNTRAPGEYRARVEFPANLFNSGAFSIVVGISVPGRVIYDRKEVMKFEFIDGGSFVVNGGGEQRRNALLLMPLKWQDLESRRTTLSL